MAQEAIKVTTPVGRFVMGDAFNGSDKDAQGRPKFDKAGKPKTTWFVGLAIPKNDPAWNEIWGQIVAVGQRDFPAGQWQQPNFAWKVVDGDGTNQEGKPYPDYCKGHYIIRMSSGFAPRIFNAQNQQITDASQIKRGDYIRAFINVRGNDDLQKPGVYVSHEMVQVVGYGEAISTGPSPEQAFGQPAALPPGASPTPVASGPMPASPMQPAGGQPGYPAATAPGMPPPYQPPVAPAATAPAPTPGAPAGYQAQPTAYPGNGQPGATAAPMPAPYPQILNGPGPTQ
jgi:hypothetical protein